MTRLRAHIAVLLITVLTLTGHSMAIARGAPGPSGFIELCTGGSPVMVAIDENGEPTGASHICPDYTLTLQNAVIAQAQAARPLELSYVRLSFVHVSAVVSLPRPVPAARGPPGLI
ncbi:hypothetical protein [Cognatishimia sp.]|uniref:hypothetical protein n=1 Tax=Cognatishimia sp. TaxID=2211648 RepID=UPI003512E546